MKNPETETRVHEGTILVFKMDSVGNIARLPILEFNDIKQAEYLISQLTQAIRQASRSIGGNSILGCPHGIADKRFCRLCQTGKW